jgi:hypothetical protein
MEKKICPLTLSSGHPRYCWGGGCMAWHVCKDGEGTCLYMENAAIQPLSFNQYIRDLEFFRKQQVEKGKDREEIR